MTRLITGQETLRSSCRSLTNCWSHSDPSAHRWYPAWTRRGSGWICPGSWSTDSSRSPPSSCQTKSSSTPFCRSAGMRSPGLADSERKYKLLKKIRYTRIKNVKELISSPGSNLHLGELDQEVVLTWTTDCDNLRTWWCLTPAATIHFNLQPTIVITDRL